MIRVILAAVDTTPRAAGVLSMALELAERFDAQVRLFRVTHTDSSFPPAAATHEDNLDRQLEEEARAALRTLAAGHPRVTVEEPVLSPLEPWRAIIEAAARVNADLIVMGSHAFGGWDRVLGTTAAKVTNHTDRHVFVVHERPESPP